VFVTLGIQHALLMRHFAICGPFPLYNVFPRYLINGTIFEKKLLNIKCVFWLSLQSLSETFLILRRTEWDMIQNVYWSSCKVPLFLSYFNETWIFMKYFRKKTLRYKISCKSVQCESSCSTRTDGRTDIPDTTKLTVAFRNFAKRVWIDKDRYLTF
jgi:hypothetical protein